MDRLLAAQSSELDKEKRRKIVWDIERILVDDAARPIVLFGTAGNCWQPYVRNFKPHNNSQYNNLRFEDVWLDPVDISLPSFRDALLQRGPEIQNRTTALVSGFARQGASDPE